MYRMIHSMRWFGPNDAVTLNDMRQAGAAEVVTALHHIPVGEIWPVAAIEDRKNEIEAAGLGWTVVESLPVHEDIKKRSGNYGKWIENYKQSIKNLAACGVQVITYNFMPALDWVRTHLHFVTPTGSTALRFEWDAYMAFDLFILQRPDAEKDYTPLQLQQAANYYNSLSPQQADELKRSCLLGLPGSTGSFSRAEVLNLLASYAGISEEQLQQNLIHFLEEIIPICEEVNMRMAIHPDDPPFPVFGLPRILSCAKHIDVLFNAVPSRHSGICFCTGSLGAREDNNLPQMLAQYFHRIHFLHLRSVQHEPGGIFYEANHLEGNANLVQLIRQISHLQQQQQRAIPIRPDHGLVITALDKAMYPGYTFIGRLKALAEIRGVEEACLITQS